MYVPALGGMDVTGDGVDDIDILQNAASDPNPANGLTKSYLDDGSFYLSGGTSGFVMFKKDQAQPRTVPFPDKYYYTPIPLQQSVLNPKLTQPSGW
jgi:hypothetical protein